MKGENKKKRSAERLQGDQGKYLLAGHHLPCSLIYPLSQGQALCGSAS
jgi:hypothetical protein